MQAKRLCRPRKRELVEETGLRAKNGRSSPRFYPSPGFLAEKMTIYLATGSDQGDATPMEDERIETKWFTAERNRQADSSPARFIDAKTMIGFLRWKRYLRAARK